MTTLLFGHWEFPILVFPLFERIFLHHGYTKQDHYFFSKKKLDAYWYINHHMTAIHVFLLVN